MQEERDSKQHATKEPNSNHKFASKIHSPIYFNAMICTLLKINLTNFSLFQKRENLYQNYCHYLEMLNQYCTKPLLAVKSTELLTTQRCEKTVSRMNMRNTKTTLRVTDKFYLFRKTNSQYNPKTHDYKLL